MALTPYLIQFDQYGNSADGYITTTQFADKIPFAVKRVFWINGTTPATIRGQHANKATQEVLVAVSGRIQVRAESGNGMQEFELSSPEQGLFIPALCWTELRFQEGTIGLCLASTEFDDSDYIREYTLFKDLLSRSI